ncbi:HAL/PAL/TAL family ammonia-lyase [Hyalangium rubrum]|uniref:Aromatic amino acid ammonia-lyase n=1 Tax=Hyalangium rubrum TaxID=3103134 RepID=A0ABU5HHC0_9BACT|nr:aromatic amino acid ammonia-lyase [Hyalangium sp. s54d21]MDY7232751.1 aromatic amino acid ammonia-lyase [Hyalangium sp. s54d21]
MSEAGASARQVVDGERLSIFDIWRVAVDGVGVELAPECERAIEATHARVQEWGLRQEPIYGVNTGFGEMIRVAIPPEHGSQLQYNLLRSHAAGWGEPFPDEVVRAVMAVRLNCLAQGYSGVSIEGAHLLEELINRRIHPIIPQQGSLGASGDLGPLAQMALALIGEGEVRYEGRRRKAAVVLEEHGLRPLVPGFKEGLALINGTAPMTAVAALALVDSYHLLRLALLVSADVVQCLGGSTQPFEHRGNALKNHAGQVSVARAMRELLAGGSLARGHEALMEAMRAQAPAGAGVVDTKMYLQNAYSLRAVPQVLGMVVETLDFCRRAVEEEASSVNDNPLIFDTPETSFHGANFHGQYVAMACDYLNIALTEVGVLAERQLNRLVDPHLNGALPAFLAYRNTGLGLGFQGGQYLAVSIASENQNLAAPSSIKSISSNGQNQDVVSMGLTAARRSRQLVENVGTILAVAVAACRQASHLLPPGDAERLSPVVREFHARMPVLREPYRDDVPLNELIAEVRQWVMGREARAFLEAKVVLGERETP